MITIFHGEDIISSRNFFLEEKQKYSQSPIHDARKLNSVELLEVLQPKNLFSQQTAIFTENIFGAKNEDLLEPLKNIPKDLHLYVWEGKELSKTELNKLKNTVVKLFKLPQNLFAFLDGIRPNNPQNVALFHQALNGSQEDIVFYMIIRQFRLLLALSDGKSSIDEVKRLAPWQLNKLQRQAGLFNNDQLRRIYKKLYEIDLAVKTGETQSLTSSIDFLLLDL